MKLKFLLKKEVMSKIKKGYFGVYGGSFVPDTLVTALDEIESAFELCQKDPEFKKKFLGYCHDFIGRETPLYFAKNLSQRYEAQIYLKREDLAHTGAHKINNTIGQCLLAKYLGKKTIIAETGAGQHGVATATAAAALGLEAVIYMGAVDYQRQKLNVQRMTLLGANVVKVTAGSKTLKEATTEAMRQWIEQVETAHYCIGSVLGPHPFPTMVRTFQSIIGQEARQQMLEKYNQLPNQVIACVGGGSNAMGIFHAFLLDKNCELIAVEAAGKGLSVSHAASLLKGRQGVLHGSLNKILQSETGQIALAHSISAGLDYPGVGPELCYYHDLNRIKAYSVTDHEALEGCRILAQNEGIIPALETAHAIAYLEKSDIKGKCLLINISGRGDKDLETIGEHLDA